MFKNRKEAGKLLGEELSKTLNGLAHYQWLSAIIVGLPRGGVIIAREIADELNAKLTILVSKKIGIPFQPELAIGAVSSTGVVVLNKQLGVLIEKLHIHIDAEIKRLAETTKALEQQWLKAAGIQEAANFKKRSVIVVDDGVATGMTTLAALRSIRSQEPTCLVLATPIISVDAHSRLTSECDYIVSLIMPNDFNAIGEFYEDFHQVEDDEVVKTLRDSRHENAINNHIS